MGGISILGIKGQIAEFKGGRTLYFDPDFVEKGIARQMLRNEELTARAARLGAGNETAALLARKDLSEDMLKRIEVEISGTLTTGQRDPSAVKAYIDRMLKAEGPEAVEAVLGELRKLNQQNYQKMGDFFARAEIKSLLEKHPSLKAGLEQNPRLADLIVNQRTLADVLLKRPEVIESLLKHPEAIEVVEQAFDKISAKGSKQVVADIKPPSTTSLKPEQLATSQRIKANAPKAKPKQPGFDKVDMTKPKQVERYVDGLYKAAAEADAELRPLTEKIAKATGGEAGFRPGPKGRERVSEKLVEYDQDASKLVDLAGSKVVYRTVDDLYKGLAVAETELKGMIVQIKDRFVKAADSGYRDILINVKMKNGHIAEFRLHLASIDTLASVEHATYEIKRTMLAAAAEQNRILTVEEQTLEAALNQTTQPLFDEALKKGSGAASP